MKFFAAFAIAATATTSAVKLNEATSAVAREETTAQADIQAWSDNLEQINSRMESRIEARTKASLEARMDALEKDMFDFGAALNAGKNLWHSYGAPLMHKYLH